MNNQKRVTVEMSQESLDFLKELKNRLETQDNRCTAAPYFLVIKRVKWRVAHDEFYGCGPTKVVRIDFENDYAEYETKEEYFTDVKSNTDDEFTDAELEEKWEELQEFTMQQYDEEENVFLTDKGYEEHLIQNKHNLGRGCVEYYTYMKHAFRNPEMEDLFKAIKDIGSK